MAGKKVYKIIDGNGLSLTTIIANRSELESEVERQLKDRPGGRHSAYEAWVKAGKVVLDETNTFYSIGVGFLSIDYLASQYRKAKEVGDDKQAQEISEYVSENFSNYADIDFITRVSDLIYVDF